MINYLAITKRPACHHRVEEILGSTITTVTTPTGTYDQRYFRIVPRDASADDVQAMADDMGMPADMLVVWA